MISRYCFVFVSVDFNKVIEPNFGEITKRIKMKLCTIDSLIPEALILEITGTEFSCNYLFL